MSDKDISQSVLEKIKQEEIKPRPKWQFLLKDYTLWLATGIFIVLSGFILATILHTAINNDWDIYARLYGSLWKFILLSLPYFWMVFLLLFIWLSKYYFQHTKKGYKFDWQLLTGASVLLSITLGVLFYQLGWGQTIDSLFAQRAPFYEHIINRRAQVWQNPERGFLAGIIIESNNREIVIRDLSGQDWEISGETLEDVREFPLQVGQPIRLVGQMIDHDNFVAEFILPFEGMRPIMERRHLLGPKHMRELDERNNIGPAY